MAITKEAHKLLGKLAQSFGLESLEVFRQKEARLRATKIYEELMTMDAAELASGRLITLHVDDNAPNNSFSCNLTAIAELLGVTENELTNNRCLEIDDSGKSQPERVWYLVPKELFGLLCEKRRFEEMCGSKD